MAPGPTVDIAAIVDRQKVGAFHVKLVVVCFLLMMTEGYDIGAAAYAAPGITKDWGLARGAVAPMLVGGLIAGLFGGPLFGWISDHIGRRLTAVGGTIFFGLFTLASVWATSLDQLVVLRFVAGIGISGTLPIVVALNNEFAPRRVRATLVVLMFSGITFGGALPGFVADAYMATAGWQLLFWIGGLAPLVVAVALALALPESIKFLSLRPERRGDLQALLGRFEPGLVLDPAARITIGGEDNRAHFSFRALFAGRLALVTPLFWITNAVCLMVFYFVNQWTPTLMPGTGQIATACFQLGGTLGGWAIMRPLDRYGFLPVPILFAIAIPIVACLGLPGLSVTAVLILYTAAGFCLLGLQFGNIASESQVFPTYIRSWGLGSCFAAGRAGGVTGPWVGGILIGLNLPTEQLFLLASSPLLIGLVAAAVLTPLYRARLGEIAAEPAAAAAE